MNPKLSIALIIAGMSSASFAQLNFLYAPSYEGVRTQQMARLGDMDADGDLDVVTVNYEDEVSLLSIAKNLGGGIFAPPVSYPVGEGARRLALGDFNSDGQKDVVVSNMMSGQRGLSDSYVTVYLNNGSGGMTNRRDYFVGENAWPEEVVVADFNRDGRDDFAVATSVDYKIHIFRSNGASPMSTMQVLSGDGPSYLDAADVNNDSRPDLVVGNVDGTFIYRNNSSGFTFNQYIDNFPDGVNGIAAADFDGDNDIDYVTSGRVLTLHVNDGAGVFSKSAQYPTGSALAGIETADIDGDGDQDVVGALYLANAISIYHNARGNLSDRRDWGVGANPWYVAVGDVNGDGKIDAVTANSDYNATTFTVAINAGEKNLAARREYPVIGDARGVETGDLDGDGFVDFVSGVYVSNQDRVAVFYGKSDGSQESAVYIENLGNNIPTDVTVGDFNGDGRKDIAASIFSPGNCVRVWLNQGGRNWAPSIILPAGGNPAGLGNADLNGDERPDIVVANGSQLDNSIHVFLTNGSGGFHPGTRIECLLRPNDATFGDWDRDGDQDFIVTHGGSTGVLLFTNNGSGMLSLSQIDLGKTQGNAVAGDFDVDGRLDVAFSTGDVTLLRGLPSGGFSSPTSSAVLAVRVTAADFDLDGDLDIASTNTVASTVNIGLNNGTGSFFSALTIPAGYGPDRLTAADLNADGKAEVLVANGTARSISVFLNRSASAMAIFAPSAIRVSFGVIRGGNLESLAHSDNNRLRIAPNSVFGKGRNQFALTIDGVLNGAAPPSMQFTIETSMNAATIRNATQTIELFDFASQRYEIVSRSGLGRIDAIRSVSITTNAWRFVHPTGHNVRARISFMGISGLGKANEALIDHAYWQTP